MRLLRRLFAQHHGWTESSARSRETVARVLAMNPRLKYARHYEEKLTRAVTSAHEYVDKLVASLPSPHEANADAWSSDPLIRAMFATREDLADAFSRSETLQTYFDREADQAAAYAVLGMSMIERHVLGVAMEGNSIRHDVPQTTLCFSDHRVSICSNSEASLRVEIGRRMIDQLALEGLASLSTMQRNLARQSRELIEERVALLEQQGTGMRAVIGASLLPAGSAEVERLQAQIDSNSATLAALRVPGRLADLEVKCVCDVMSSPSDHLFVASRRVRLDVMNVIQPDGVAAAHEIECYFARVPGNPPITRTFALVRFPRKELLPAGLRIDLATRAI